MHVYFFTSSKIVFAHFLNSSKFHIPSQIDIGGLPYIRLAKIARIDHFRALRLIKWHFCQANDVQTFHEETMPTQVANWVTIKTFMEVYEVKTIDLPNIHVFYMFSGSPDLGLFS